MRFVFLAVILFTCNFIGQSQTTDSAILTTLFGSVDDSSTSFTRKLNSEEKEYSDDEEITFNIIFKKDFKLDNQDVVIVAVKAVCGYEMGYNIGYSDLYFLNNSNGKLSLLSSFKAREVGPIQDVGGFEIIDIGGGHKALVSYIESTGNGHYEKTTYIRHIQKEALYGILSIYSEYDNSMWVAGGSDEECTAEMHQATYELLKGSSEINDIKVTRIDFGFYKGCKRKYKKSETVELYEFKDGQYKLKNTKTRELN